MAGAHGTLVVGFHMLFLRCLLFPALVVSLNYGSFGCPPPPRPIPHRAGKSARVIESEPKDQPIPLSLQVSTVSPIGLLKSGTRFPIQTLQTSLFLLSPGEGWGSPFSGNTLLLSCSKTPDHGLNKVPSVLHTTRPILELQTTSVSAPLKSLAPGIIV